MDGLFDLNIEKVLENWTVSDALREIIANALDEKTLSNSKDIEIYKENNTWHVRDFGRGIQYKHFTQNENNEKNQAECLIGKFGVGLKDALAVFYRHNCEVSIDSKYHHISIQMAPKTGFDVLTLHALFQPPKDQSFVGTDFAINGVSDLDVEKAKTMFLVFSSSNLLEKTKYGEIYSCSNGNAHIYINGVMVATENNFMFSYNITSMNTQIKKALNRERTNVGRSAYADTVKNILKSSSSDIVLFQLVRDLQHRMSGTNKDETTWVDVAKHAATVLNKTENVVFMTPSQRADISNQQKEILDESGKKLVLVTEDIYQKIQSDVPTFGDVYRQYSNSFRYSFIEYQDLTEQEKKVFDLHTSILDLLSNRFRICQEIKISETIRTDQFGNTTLGIRDGNRVILKRDVLSDPISFCGTLAHELCHYQHGYDDNSRSFENDLTNMLGLTLYSAIKSRETNRNDFIKRNKSENSFPKEDKAPDSKSKRRIDSVLTDLLNRDK